MSFVKVNKPTPSVPSLVVTFKRKTTESNCETLEAGKVNLKKP